MPLQLASISSELVQNQAGVAVHDTSSPDGHYWAMNVTFSFADGHYGKRQLLEKAKRLVDEASAFLKAEIAKSP
jgi:hypothetical protein